jgi:hypothetical protein
MCFEAPLLKIQHWDLLDPVVAQQWSWIMRTDRHDQPIRCSSLTLGRQERLLYHRIQHFHPCLMNSGVHYIYIYTHIHIYACLTFSNSSFCPQSVWVSYDSENKQRLFSKIKCISVVETRCVFFEVRAEFLNIIYMNFRFQRANGLKH